MSFETPAVAWASLPKRAQMKGGVASLIGMTPKGSQSRRLRLTRDMVGKWLTDKDCATFVRSDWGCGPTGTSTVRVSLETEGALPKAASVVAKMSVHKSLVASSEFDKG